MAEQPTTLFDPPAGDRPASEVYQPGTWLADPPAADHEKDAGPSPVGRGVVQPERRRLLLHRLLEAQERLARRRSGEAGMRRSAGRGV
jgi:hypothetical protein